MSKEALIDRGSWRIIKPAGIDQAVLEQRREGLAFQKWWDWQARKRMVPEEVLAASDATLPEIDFLLGRSGIDPNPLRTIRYFKLAVGNKFVIFPDSVDIDKPILPDFRIPSVNLSKRDLSDSEVDSSLERQLGFRRRVDHAIGLAWNQASDFTLAEFSAVEGISDYYGNKVKDPYPSHLPRYRTFIPNIREPLTGV